MSVSSYLLFCHKYANKERNIRPLAQQPQTGYVCVCVTEVHVIGELAPS